MRESGPRTVRVALVVAALVSTATAASADPGTRQQRAALFEELLKKTLERTAFSPHKPYHLGLPPGVAMAEHVEAEMQRLRPLLLQAKTDMELFWALSALSNVRRDQHVGISPAVNGIAIDVEIYGPTGEETRHAPVKFKPDYSDPANPVFFVSDLAADIRHRAVEVVPEIGDTLVAVNDRPVDEYVSFIARYLTSSTDAALWWSVSNTLPIRFYGIPPEAYREDDRLRLELQAADGRRSRLDLPYVPYRDIEWQNYEDHPFYGTQAQQSAAAKIPRYPGYERVLEGGSFDVYRSTRADGPLLLSWHRFGRSMLQEIPRLLGYAEAEGLTDAGLIWDGTRSTGGGGGAWALQRLQPKPFRMTFGNLRISDVTRELADALEAEARQGIAAAEESPEASSIPPARRIQTIDSGRFLLDWLESDVYPAITAGQAYTNDVPFKAYFLPRYSDGRVYPADRHLTGPMAMLLGPFGCSHLDQFAAMFIDNDLGFSTGMPAGGCSNTWEYEEVLRFPGTETPIVTYRWTVGQTLRPNGQVLEGNPASVGEYVPLTRGNYETYYGDRLRSAEAHVAAAKSRRRKPQSGPASGRTERTAI